ncbi:MAG: hypothetical protein LBR13_06730 [Dysgonamonadaceae bacterium]|jgi:hypothetical protein|nr:hypothetical protein [Dysgonamonadaceae bacterium]
MEQQNVTLNLSGIQFSIDSQLQERIIKEVTNALIDRFDILAKDILAKLPLNSLPISDSSESKEAPAPAKKRTRTKLTLEEKLYQDIKLFPAYNRHPQFFDEMGFKNLYDMLVYQHLHNSPAYFQEQTFITDFINESELKVFVNKAEVKKLLKADLKKQKEDVKKEKKIPEAIEQVTGEITINTAFANLEASKTLKGFARKSGIITINDAILYCNEVKLKALLKEGAVNKHSMIYQMVKLLSALGFAKPQMEVFLKKVDGTKTLTEDSKSKPEKVTRSRFADDDYTEERGMKSRTYHNFNEKELDILYSNVNDYNFSDELKFDYFKKLRIYSIFELLFWVCGISRDYVSYKFNLDKDALTAFEGILEEHDIIESVKNIESLNYTYKSKYYHYIRYYRNKIINKQLSLLKFNKNLTEEEQNRLYTPVEELGFSDSTLAIIQHNKITTTIGLIAYINYGCDTAYPNQFTEDVLDEIDKVMDVNGFNKYKYNNYVNGLRSYYYKSSLFLQKRRAELENAAPNDNV